MSLKMEIVDDIRALVILILKGGQIGKESGDNTQITIDRTPYGHVQKIHREGLQGTN
jgi:hypothetical protein